MSEMDLDRLWIRSRLLPKSFESNMLQALTCVQLNPHAGKIEQEVTFDKVWQSDAACEDHCEPPSPDKWPNMHVSKRYLHAIPTDVAYVLAMH